MKFIITFKVSVGVTTTTASNTPAPKPAKNVWSLLFLSVNTLFLSHSFAPNLQATLGIENVTKGVKPL